jgi:outer membrane protein assembly factor BamB
LTDKEPLRRAAAGCVLGRADPGRRAAVRRLLTDAEPRVRFETAVALARAGDKESVPGLIAMLGDGPMSLGWRAQEILYRIAGDKSPPVALADDKPAERARVADAWRTWWKENERTTNLASINLDETLQGINLICDEMYGGRVWACRADGKPIWEIRSVSAWDAQLLPNGRVLIGEYGGSQVTERDLTGKVLQTYRVNSTVSSCKRLPNGNTFVSTFSEMHEFDPKGTMVFSYKHPNGGLIARSHHLRNGHLVFASNGDKIVELDAERKEVRTIPVMANGDSWISVEPLLGDRYLIAAYGASKVYETDASGKIYFEATAEHPMSAVRLPNGNTLVSSNTGRRVMEYNRNGQEVWKLDCGAPVRCVRRY